MPHSPTAQVTHVLFPATPEMMDVSVRARTCTPENPRLVGLERPDTEGGRTTREETQGFRMLDNTTSSTTSYY